MPGASSDTGNAHHPVFSQFRRWRGAVKPGFEANPLGVLTRSEFCTIDGNFAASGRADVEPPLPQFDEEYFEWVDVLEAVLAAESHFVMIELGAGWGRWLMNGAAAARQRGLPFKLVGVEAEPTHFRWMRQHFDDNDVADDSLVLEQAAVAGHPGWVPFHVGDPAAWYGQAIDLSGVALQPPLLEDLRPGRPTDARTRAVVRVRALSLAQLLAKLDVVDLIDLDVQGVEADVLESAAASVDAQVKRVHVGTHSLVNEDRLRVLFRQLGWENRNDFTFAAENDTPYGRIAFQDGVQTWINPRLNGNVRP